MTTTKQIEFKFSIIVYLLVILTLVIMTATILAIALSLLMEENYFFSFVILLIPSVIYIDVVPRLIRISKCIFKNKAALILTKDQLIDNINDKIIKWSDIKTISIQNNRNTNYIAIKLNNPNEYIQKSNNWYEKLIMKLNGKYFNGTISISPNLIKGKKVFFYQQLEKYSHKKIHF